MTSFIITALISTESCSTGTHLVCGIVVLLQVGVSQRLLHTHAVVGVEGEHLVEQVKRLGVGVRVECRPGHLGLVGQRLQVAPRLRAANGTDVNIAKGIKLWKAMMNMAAH